MNNRGRFAALVAQATKDLNADLEAYPELNCAIGLECLMDAYLEGHTGRKACREARKHLKGKMEYMMKVMRKK